MNKIKEEDKKAQKKSNEMNRNKPILHTGIHENKAAAVEVKQAREKERQKMVILKHAENTNNAMTLTTLKTTKNIFYIKYIVFLTLCIFVCYTKLQRTIVHI